MLNEMLVEMVKEILDVMLDHVVYVVYIKFSYIVGWYNEKKYWKTFWMKVETLDEMLTKQLAEMWNWCNVGWHSEKMLDEIVNGMLDELIEQSLNCYFKTKTFLLTRSSRPSGRRGICSHRGKPKSRTRHLWCLDAIEKQHLLNQSSPFQVTHQIETSYTRIPL